jgi:hypothetical protein
MIIKDVGNINGNVFWSKKKAYQHMTLKRKHQASEQPCSHFQLLPIQQEQDKSKKTNYKLKKFK